jgi:ribosomal-protein-alanine N-acetyltransferase
MMNDFPILVTERLILRQLSDKDVQEVFLLRSDKFINKYLDRQPCKTIEDAFEFIEKIKNNSLTYWAITQKGDDKLVGTICLFNVSEELKTCEIGYELLAEYQGKGIMKEAAKKVIKFATQTLEIETIDAYTHQDNESSNNLLKALKFISANTVDDVNTNLILFQLSICKVE